MKQPSNTPLCPLCDSPSSLFHTFRSLDYLRCSQCESLFLHPDKRLNPEAEKARYEEHNNDVNDEGYRRFTSPITDSVLKLQTPNHSGLDFGAGTGPVIATVLSEHGYHVDCYDPFFHPTTELLHSPRDYIICCEVMEHFYNPMKEFILLRSILKPMGRLFCMTELWSEDKDFLAWPYKNDNTHVFLYSQKSLQIISKTAGYSSVSTEGRLIIFNA